MLYAAICDDCPDQAENILKLLNNYQAERLGIEICPQIFNSANDLLNSLDNQEYDLYLLDIIMPELCGIELAKKLREKNKDTSIIFLTSSIDYAYDAFKVSAAQYLLKPIKEDEFFPVLDKIITEQAREEENYFIFSAQESYVKISYSSIICVELVKRAVCVYLNNGLSINSRTIRMPFAEYIAPLLQDSRFILPHSSFALNMTHVDELTRDSFVMKNGVVIPVPRYKYAGAKSGYFKFLSERGIGLPGRVKS